MNRVLAGGATLVTAYVVYPVIKFIVPPIAPVDAQSKVQAATLDEMKPNSAKFFRFLDRSAVLVKLPDGTYKALSAKCTHLGCTLAFEQDREMLYCNCHGSEFSIDGKVLKGPAAQPLSRYLVSISGDNIYVETQS